MSDLTIKDLVSFIPKPTRRLIELLHLEAEQTVSELFVETLLNLHAVYSKYSAALRNIPAGPERATIFHNLITKTLEASEIPYVSCSKGCFGCCHFEVEITEDEALLLAEQIDAGIQIDLQLLKTQALRIQNDPAWEKFFAPENRCVFLGPDHLCRVYDSRPSACRKLLVSTPSEACTTPGARVNPVAPLLTELFLSAAISLEDNPIGSLAKMLLPKLSQPPGSPE